MIKLPITTLSHAATTFGIASILLLSAAAVAAKNPTVSQQGSTGVSLAPPTAHLIGKGDYWRGHGELEKAIALYSEAIRVDPGCGVALIGRAKSWLELGKVDKAMADCNSACKTNPPFNRQAFRARGDLYQSLHKYPEAIKDYTTFLSMNPTDGVYFNRGACHLKMNKAALAIKDFDSALAMGAHRPMTYERRGDAYLVLKQYLKALADYDMALKIDPEGNKSKDGHELLHKNKAEIYKRMGKLDLAKKETAAAAVGRNSNLDVAPFATEFLR